MRQHKPKTAAKAPAANLFLAYADWYDRRFRATTSRTTKTVTQHRPPPIRRLRTFAPRRHVASNDGSDEHAR